MRKKILVLLLIFLFAGFSAGFALNEYWELWQPAIFHNSVRIEQDLSAKEIHGNYYIPIIDAKEIKKPCNDPQLMRYEPNKNQILICGSDKQWHIFRSSIR